VAEESNSTSRKYKRRVRPSETVREKRAKQRRIEEKPKRRPLAKVRHYLAVPFRWIGSRPLWQSKFWRPFRFVGRILSYVLFISYFRNSWRELRDVTWPSWKLSWRLTWAVLVFSIFFGVIVALVDYGFDKLFKRLILNA